MNEAAAVVEEIKKEQEETKQALAPIKSDITGKVVNSWNDMQRMAQAFSTSSLIPAHLKGKFADVLVILQQSKELGIGPMQGLNGINVIQGKPSVSPELQLALVRSAVPDAYIKVEVDHEKLVAKCTAAPSRDRMDEGYTSLWDMKRAKEMGLDTKDNYRKQPATMLKWRAIGEALRTVFPHVTKGLYNFEEADDFVSNKGSSPKIKDLFPAQKAEPEPIDAELADGPSGVEVEG